MQLSTRIRRQFCQTVMAYYMQAGRHDLPWRQTRNPYHILVSELMLQQTQVARVIPKYEAFLQQFPTTKALANASLREVLELWQGLGYNRRAKFLHQAAVMIEHKCAGQFPTTYESLRALPGVGSYTTGAIMAFAFNKPVPIIETNIRTVFIHHFFAEQELVADDLILELVTQTLVDTVPRQWYAALMDYGTHLKQSHGNNISQSAAYHRQLPFAGSNRQVRGHIVRTLTRSASCTESVLLKAPFGIIEKKCLRTQLAALEKDGLIEKSGRRYQLVTTLNQ